MSHCDDLIDDQTQPECLRRFLHYKRLPAVCQMAGHRGSRFLEMVEDALKPFVWTDPEPVLFADHEGKRVRVVMASRFGDVGITDQLQASRGYTARVPVDALTNFGTEP